MSRGELLEQRRKAMRKYKRHRHRCMVKQEQLSSLEHAIGIAGWQDGMYRSASSIPHEWSMDAKDRPTVRIAPVPASIDPDDPRLVQREQLIKQILKYRKKFGRAAAAVVGLEDRLGLPPEDRYAYRTWFPC